MVDKTILITGTSRGLGLDIARHYAPNNKVVGLSRGDAAFRNENYTHCQCDISKPIQLRETLRALTRRFTRIDVLINNAAVLKSLPLAMMDDADIESMIYTNLLGAVLCTKRVFRLMIKNGSGGRIVNITSMADRILAPGDSVYAATKSAVETFSRILNREGVRFGVRVNNLAVSAYPSGMLSQIIHDEPERVTRFIPHGSVATLPEIIRALDFLADSAGNDIGGQTLRLGGI